MKRIIVTLISILAASTVFAAKPNFSGTWKQNMEKSTASTGSTLQSYVNKVEQSGDTLRVVQRDNLPSPVVAGTTYRNVYIAVELIGRVNAECLANQIGVGPAQRSASQPATSSCAFLGGAATGGAQNPRPPTQ